LKNNEENKGFLERNKGWILPCLAIYFITTIIILGALLFLRHGYDLNEYGDTLAGVFAPLFFAAILFQNYMFSKQIELDKENNNKLFKLQEKEINRPIIKEKLVNQIKKIISYLGSFLPLDEKSDLEDAIENTIENFEYFLNNEITCPIKRIEPNEFISFIWVLDKTAKELKTVGDIDISNKFSKLIFKFYENIESIFESNPTAIKEMKNKFKNTECYRINTINIHEDKRPVLEQIGTN
jgi:hypothetical protein